MHKSQLGQSVIQDLQSVEPVVENILLRYENDLARCDEVNVRASIAGDQNTPLETLAGLAADPVGIVRQKVALNVSCPVALLEVLSSDTDRWVREAVACHALCPVDLLERLIADQDIMVRMSAIAHPNISGSMLETLFEQGARDLRRAMASNPNCTPATLHRLASEPNPSTRLDVIAHTNTPVLLLLQLACFDSYQHARDQSRDKLETMEQTKWKESVSAGLSLFNAMECSVNPDAVISPGLNLGDTLINSGLTNIYQAIQQAELEVKVNQLGNGGPVEQLPSTTVKMRM